MHRIRKKKVQKTVKKEKTKHTASYSYSSRLGGAGSICYMLICMYVCIYTIYCIIYMWYIHTY